MAASSAENKFFVAKCESNCDSGGVVPGPIGCESNVFDPATDKAPPVPPAPPPVVLVGIEVGRVNCRLSVVLSADTEAEPAPTLVLGTRPCVRPRSRDADVVLSVRA